MKNYHWELFRYSLRLIRPLVILGEEFRIRNGLILRLNELTQGSFEDTIFGEGEIAPFPRLHPESLVEAETQILDYLSGNNNFNLYSKNLFSSVRFGLDMAIRTSAKKLHESISQKNLLNLKSNQKKIIDINGLIIDTSSTLESECENLQKEGYKTIKMKVGRKSLKEDIKRVRKVRKILGNDISLRLDANRSWKWKDALFFSHAVKEYNIQYCEEPLIDPKDIEKLYHETEIPFALDETLWENPNPKVLPKIGIKALILKPGIFGTWKNIKFWSDFSEKNGMDLVLSSSFESGLGLNWIAFMANKILKKRTALGLDTSKYFKNDLIEPPFKIINGGYTLKDSWPKASEKYLQKIAEGKTKIELLADD